jgi:hypothetical protein
MDRETLTFALAIFGAALSTALAIPKILEFRYTILRKLRIRAEAKPPFESLDIVISNEGRRPVTIDDVFILYGPEPQFSQLVDSWEEKSSVKLEESDAWRVSILRDELVGKAKSNVKQDYNHRLWVGVRTVSGRTLHRVVDIHPSIISGRYPREAEHFLASDSFLRFPRMKSKVKKISHKY